MANIDIATNRTNGVFKDLGSRVINNADFRVFINSLSEDKLRDTSFTSFVKNLDSLVLRDRSFIQALQAINARNADVLTNTQFTDTISLMKAEFLRSQEFADFLDSFDLSIELDSLDSRGNEFSFLGRLEADFFEVLSGLNSEVLTDDVFNYFVNSVDLGAFNDGSFKDFIFESEQSTLMNINFLSGLSGLSRNVLTNGSFTNDLENISTSFLESSDFFFLIDDIGSSSSLAERGENYVSIANIGGSSPFPVIPAGSYEATNLRSFARFAVNKVVEEFGLEDINSDVGTIVDRYFSNIPLAPGQRLSISSQGFAGSETTESALQAFSGEILAQRNTLYNTFSELRSAINNGTRGSISTNLREIGNILQLEDDLFNIQGSLQPRNQRSERREELRERWKYTGIRTVPGLLAGGVGVGGPPPSSADLLLDSREVSRNSNVDIIIDGGRLTLEIDYEVTLRDTFDFVPGGGGLLEGIAEFATVEGSPLAPLIGVGVSTLRTLEQLDLVADVPFETSFISTQSTSINVV